MSYDENDSEFLRHEPCPSCGSKDNLARYSDGHGHCFGCGHYEPPEGEFSGVEVERKRGGRVSGLLDGEVKELNARKLTEDTCKKFGYKVGTHKGKAVQIAPYYNGNTIVAQKIRTKDKDFYWKGEPKQAGLFGQNLWRDGGKRLVITEGEIDAMSVSQAQGNKWPVVSVPNGAQGAKKDLAKHLEWIEKFETIVLCFDNDEPGIKAAESVARMFKPGKVKIARLPLKDANEMLKAGRHKEIIDALWDAKDYRPASISSVSDLLVDALKKPEMGIPWPWPTLTDLTFGIHRKKVYYLGAGVGIGKTNWAQQLQSWLVNEIKTPVGVFMLEQSAGRTIKTIAGKFAGIPFHKPDAVYTEEQLQKAVMDMEGKVFVYRHDIHGSDWESIKPAIRAMVHYGGVRDIFLDNLTVMVAHLTATEANEEINLIAKELSELVHELDITIYGFSHLNPPKTGEPHERGGRVHEAQFTGSRGLMRFGDYLFGIERNKDPELSEKERNTSTLVLLKDREYGNVGQFHIYYDKDTDSYLEPPQGFLLFGDDEDESDGADNGANEMF